MKKLLICLIIPSLLLTGCSSDLFREAEEYVYDTVYGNGSNDSYADDEDEDNTSDETKEYINILGNKSAKDMQDIKVKKNASADPDTKKMGIDSAPAADSEVDNTQDQENTEGKVTTGELNVVTGKRYDSFYLPITPAEFEELGFSRGDGVDVTLSNGEVYYNIPYYTDDYCRLFEYYVTPNIYDNSIDVCCNYLPGFYIEEGIDNSTTATITLHEKGKYKYTEERMNIEYSDNPSDFPSREVFANFRELSGGKIAAGKFYRGASPVNNNRNRCEYVNELMEEKGINYVLDLADSEKTFRSYDEKYDTYYTYGWDMYQNDSVYFVDMDFSYTNPDYAVWIADGLKDMIDHDGPYYIHCNEGMDRTGFVCALLEGLAGASYKEMRNDYMITYHNYYGIDKDSDPETYDLIEEIYFDSFMMLLHGNADHKTLQKNNYQKDIENYLLSGGMTKKQIKKLKKLLTTPYSE